MVGITFGPVMLEGGKSLLLVKQLLLSYLTGFALSSAVSFLWFPLTSRFVFLVGAEDFIGICETVLKEERCSLGALMCKRGDEGMRKKQASKVRGLAMTMLISMARLREELGYARQEIAVGVYDGDVLLELLRCCEGLMIPILGLSKIEGFVRRNCDVGVSCAQKRMVKESFRAFEDALQKLSGGKQKMAILMETNFFQRKVSEASADVPVEEAVGALENLDYHMDVAVPELKCFPGDAKFDKKASTSGNGKLEVQKVAQQQLYIQCLLSSASQASNDLAAFSDKTLADGRNRGTHLILPSASSWLPSRSLSPTSLDPEHLPPATSSQTLGNFPRHLLSSLSSDASKFGLRVTFATLSIGILAFLHQTHHFFIRYRLVWAMVMIPISMSPTSGTAIYGFIGRAVGVAATMVLTYVNWYVVDGKPVGVILVFGLCMMGYYWLLLKWPGFVVLFVLGAVNHVLIVGEYLLCCLFGREER